MEFDPRKVNEYSIEELIAYIDGGVVTFEDFQRCGLRWDKQAVLKEIEHECLVDSMREEENWQTACSMNTIQAYEFYLSNYGDDARYALEAKSAIACVYGPPIVDSFPFEDLFADMRENMLKYKADVMCVLFGKIPPTDEMRDEDSPIGRFLRAGLKLTYEDLHRSGILPEGNRSLEKAIFKDDFVVPSFPIVELGEVLPNDRNDVYIIGCPGSGKSCMLAGILTYLHFTGEIQYVPTKNAKGIDGCLSYYHALVTSLSEYKAPRSKDTDPVSFLQVNLGSKYDHNITAMEINAEVFKIIWEMEFPLELEGFWDGLGVGRCQQNNNPKTLFFLLDYSTIIGKNPRYSETDQAQILEDALVVFNIDGTGKHGEKGCTMSKVRTLTIVITKSDLMDVEKGRPLTREERADIAFECLKERFANFMNNLSELCHKYGINANNKGHVYEPFVTTFSLGQFYLGNSVVFDDTDSKQLAEYIMVATDRYRRGIWGFLKR